MWFIQPRKNYIPEMPWERIDEPELMSWQIRARDYNTSVANIVFLIMLLFLRGWWYFFGFIAGEDDFIKKASIVMFFTDTYRYEHDPPDLHYRLSLDGQRL